MKLASVLMITLLIIGYEVQSQNLGWAHKIGSSGEEYPISVAIDALGNVITAGTFESTIDFDPGSGTANLTSNGSRDIFIQKLSNSGSYIWATHIGNSNGDYCQSMHMDDSGYIYLTGQFEDTIDFDPGPSVLNLTESGISAQYVCKLNSSGGLVWAKSNGGIARTEGYGITTDKSGNVITTGDFQNISDFDPDTGTYNLTATAVDVFVQKLSPSGNLIWALSFGDTQNDYGYDVAVDTQNNIYVTGYFVGTVDFDPGTDTFYLTSGGSLDVFISKFDSTGNFIWARNFSGPGYDQVFSITVDGAGNSYTTGYFRNTVDFDPGSGTYNLTASGNYDLYLVKLDPSGNLVWVNQISSPGSDIGVDVRLDQSGNLYLAGVFDGTADFDPSADTFNLTAAGFGDAFAAKYTTSGSLVWARNTVGSNIALGSGIDADNQGNVFMSGRFGGTADFDPGPGTFNLTTSGGLDGFIMKFCEVTYDSTYPVACDSFVSPSGLYVYDSSGVYHDTLAGSNGCDSIITINLTINESSFLLISPTACDSFASPAGKILKSTGLYYDTLSSTSGCDSIIAVNLTINQSYQVPIITSDCDSFISPSGNYTWYSTGTYYDSLLSISGCDSVIIVNLTVLQSNSSSMSMTVCDSVESLSGNYSWSSTGTYNDTLTNGVGCDSVITVNLTVFQSSFNSISITACDSVTSPSGKYTWTTSGNYSDTLQTSRGCDSIFQVALTINNYFFVSVSIDACDSLISPSGKYSWNQSGTYLDTLSSSTGCDSVVEVNLTVTIVDVTISNNDPVLTSNANGASYQWLDCSNSQIIVGETGQSFTASENGNYSVIISENSCIDTSNCEPVISLGLDKANSLSDINYYPNPIDDDFSLEFGQDLHEVNVIIRDYLGKEIQRSFCRSCNTMRIKMTIEQGAYSVEVRSLEGRKVLKVIKN